MRYCGTSLWWFGASRVSKELCGFATREEVAKWSNLTSIKVVRQSTLQPGGMIQETLCIDYAATPSELGSPTGAGVWSFLGTVNRACRIFALCIFCDVKNTSLPNVGQYLVRSSAIVDIGDDCSTFGAPSPLKFGRDCL